MDEEEQETAVKEDKNLTKSLLPRRLLRRPRVIRRRKLQRRILPRKILLTKRQKRRLQMPRPKLRTLKSANPALKRRVLKRSARSLVESKIQNGGGPIFGAINDLLCFVEYL